MQYTWIVREMTNRFGSSGFVLAEAHGAKLFLDREGVVRVFPNIGDALAAPHWKSFSEAQMYLNEHESLYNDTYVKPKPPLGVIPREQWREGTVRERINELKRAICEYVQAETITEDLHKWTEELRERVADLAMLMDKDQANKRK